MAALASGAIWLLSACSNTMLNSENVNQDGLLYYLPKTIVTLTINAYGHVTKTDGDAAAGGLDSYVEHIDDIRLETVTPVEIADRSRSYSLSYDPNIASHDRVCMGVSDKGLLQYVEGAAEDKTGDIIVSLAKLAGRLARPGAFATTVAIDDYKKNYFLVKTITLDIDPLDRTHWHQVNHAMYAAFGSIARKHSFKVEDADQLMRDAREPDTCPLNSVCYRSRVPVRFTLGTGSGATSSLYKEVINRRVTGHIDVSRALLVEKITRLNFSSGVLTGVNIRKPSEGLALAKLPLTVLDAITTSALAAPGSFVGQIGSGGLASAQATSLISQSASNATSIVNLQTQLASIRNGDLGAEQPADNAIPFKLNCSVTAKSAGG